jgi:hypothetical protein
MDEIASLTYYYIDQNTFHDLRNCAAFVLSHFYLLRGESARGAELPDLQAVNLEQEGPTNFCPVLVLVMKNGKTNKAGRWTLVRAYETLISESVPSWSPLCTFFQCSMSIANHFPISSDPKTGTSPSSCRPVMIVPRNGLMLPTIILWKKLSKPVILVRRK